MSCTALTLPSVCREETQGSSSAPTPQKDAREGHTSHQSCSPQGSSPLPCPPPPMTTQNGHLHCSVFCPQGTEHCGCPAPGPGPRTPAGQRPCVTLCSHDAGCARLGSWGGGLHYPWRCSCHPLTQASSAKRLTGPERVPCGQLWSSRVLPTTSTEMSTGEPPPGSPPVTAGSACVHHFL